MSKDLISICIANYNKGAYIKRCLDSIRRYENIPNLEIVIIDDCSTDNSIIVIQKWKKNNSDISLIFKKNHQNSGPGNTYNIAVKEANGAYISFMDSDDFFINSSLSNKRKKLKSSPLLEIIYGNGLFYEEKMLSCNTIHENSLLLFKNFKYNPIKILSSIYSKVPLLSVSSSLVKKDFLLKIGGFDSDSLSNDWILNIKIFQALDNKDQFFLDMTPAFGYRIYSGNISKRLDIMLQMLSEVIKKYCPQELKNKGYSNIYFTNALGEMTLGNYKKSFSSIKKSLSYNFEPKKLLIYTISLGVPPRFLNLLPKRILQKIKSFILNNFQ